MSANNNVYSVTKGNFKGEIDFYDFILLSEILKKNLVSESIVLENSTIYLEIEEQLKKIRRLEVLIGKIEGFINEI